MIIDNSRFETRLNRPKFRAIPKAMYRPAKDSYVKIYELEKNDLPFVTNFLGNLKQFFKKKNVKDFSTQQVVAEAFEAAKRMLEMEKCDKKSTMLLALKNNEPCGILLGNIPKKDKNNVIRYSSRKNHSKKETELDWLATWGVHGCGKSLVCEFFKQVKENKFSKVFVRSEVPELSFAKEFYESVGFHKINNDREKIMKATTSEYLIGNYDNPGDDIIPMIAGKNNINNTINKISEHFKRNNLSNPSVNLENIIK